MTILLITAATFAAAWLLTPIFRRFALGRHIVARQNHRTVHKGEVPKLGGASVIAAFLIGTAAAIAAVPGLFRPHAAELISLTAGAVILFLLGAFDDKADLNCNLKLLVEIFVAAGAVTFGWRMEAAAFTPAAPLSLGLLSYPLSILWIVGVTNSFNMIDGLDGLAGGIAIVVLLCSAAIAALFGNWWLVPPAMLLIGAVLGFLRYNIHPASIFLGDSGSLSLGFMLALLTLRVGSFDGGAVPPLVPLLLLALPLTDTALAIIRRSRRGIHPFHADREHIHHRLVALGLTQPGAAGTMVGLSAILGLIAYLAAYTVNLSLHAMK